MLAFVFVAAVLVGVAYLLMPTCPQCQGRGSVRWQHQRVGGGPDRRFAENYQYCSACGWSTRVEPDVRPARAPPESNAAAPVAEVALSGLVFEPPPPPPPRPEDGGLLAAAFVLRSVGTSDRKFSPAEREAIAATLSEMFSVERQAVDEAVASLSGWSPDLSLGWALERCSRLADDQRARLADESLALTLADGKATPVESDYAARIASALRRGTWSTGDIR